MTVIQIARAPAGIVARLRARPGQERMTASAALVLGAAGTLLVLGLVMVLSSSWVSAYQRYGSSYLFFVRQLIWVGIGCAAMVVAAVIDYRRFRILAYVLLAASIAGLVLVLVPGVGKRAGGAARWLSLGPLNVQPSELAKLAVALVVADLCVRKGPRRLQTTKDVVMPVGIVVGCVGILVMAQPDLGTSLILGGIVLSVLFLAGVPMRILAGFGALSVAGTALLSLSEGYRRARLFSFIDPFADPLNTGYQAVQGQIALGSGGLFGVGLGASRQKWAYVPNAHTDFIFAIIGEELGLIGTFAVIAVFGLMAYAGIRIARRAPDAFGRIAAGAVTAWIVGQAIVNMGAVTGLLPITGVPLPLVSFGGSSLVFTMIALGVLMNIARQERWPPAATEPSGGAGAPKPARARAKPARSVASARKARPRAGPTSSATRGKTKGTPKGRARPR